MILDLRDITDDGLEIDEALELPDARSTRLRGSARRGESRDVELTGRVDSRVRLECGRCLESFEHEIACEFFLRLVGAAVEYGGGESELRPADAALFYVDAGRADLRQIASEQILLHQPLKPVCGPSCKGLCPTCGENRNRIECSCRRTEIDPRLAPLIDIKKQIDGP